MGEKVSCPTRCRLDTSYIYNMRRRTPSFDGLHACDMRHGIVLRGADNNDYIARNGRWDVFEDASYELEQIGVDEDGNGNGNGNGTFIHVEKPRKRIIDILPILEIETKLNQLVISEVLNLPRKRGRPPKPKKESKTKRVATSYNVFVKEFMQIIQIEMPHLTNRQRMQECAARWRQKTLFN